MNEIRRRLAGLLLLTLLPGGALALEPADAGSVLERSRDMREFLEDQRRLRAVPQPPADAQIDDQTDSATDTPAAGDARFVLQQVMFSRSDVLAADELRDVAGRYVGREVRVSDLFALLDDVNALYRARQIIAAKAVLPPQKIEQGTVRIRLVEGRVGRLLLDGNDTTNDAFITAGLPTLQAGELVYLDELESDLFYFNSVNDIELRATLKPGEAFATTDYVLRVVEPPAHEVTVFTDNAGRDDVGLYRIGAAFANRSLSGRRDVFKFGGHVAEGTKAVYTSYSVPLNSRGTRLGLNADYSEIEIIDGPLEPLDVSGDSVNAGVFVTHPLQVLRSGVTNGYVGYSFKESTTDFDDVTLLKTFVRTLTAGVDIQRSSIDQSWFGRFYVTGAPNSWGNTQSFIRWNGEYSRIRVLPSNWVVLYRARAQVSAAELLPSSEQFQIGGMSTVRGYPEGLLIGDEGYFISAEATFPLSEADAVDPSANPFTQRLRGILFVDHGAAFPFKGNNEGINSDDFLTSIGGGIAVNLGRRTQGRLVFGVPLDKRDDDEDGVTLHFYIQSGLF
ncbi:MAG: ShlB/FhaC/HecB family hemolysin secretion/activation protein [Gammaproteobacteria bacterium]|nr:ShlB/FhaC/HecB family hemolysin secretion/activation protein [Gammaproteobacteria bacterium]